ncbi:MAG: CotH kinase family protein [Flavobacteriales bacterium]
MHVSTVSTPIYRIGIEVRGASSQAYPKKSFGIEFWADPAGTSTVDVSLLGMRTDDDWNLNAQWIEPLRLRSMLGQELWMDVHAPYYAALEPGARSGVRMRHVELFLNGSYRGLYALGEQVDRKQLMLKNYNGTIRGELYKGVDRGNSTFTSIEPYDNASERWGGFEYVFPDEEIDWSRLYDFVRLVVQGDEAEFNARITSELEIGNAVDYFLFLNLLRALDNTDKNIFVARYTTLSPYFYVPWDLDAILGVFWDGSLDPNTEGILGNGLYDRLRMDCSAGGFMEKARIRWNELRAGVFSVEDLMQRFTAAHARLMDCRAYEREQLAWPTYTHSPDMLGYLRTWLNGRVAFLDGWFAEACISTGVADAAAPVFRIWPVPASDQVHIAADPKGGQGRLSVCDALGRTMIERSFNGPEQVLDISALLPGTYLVVLLGDDRTFVQQRLQVVR